MFDSVKVGQSQFKTEAVIEHLSSLLTESRRQKIEKVIERRTLDVVPVVENLYDRGNVSAVMRSAEGLGYQNLHVIQPGTRFKEANRVTQGADKWLDVNEWKSTKDCIQQLKQRGYKVCVTSLENARPIDEIDFLRPTAVVFGNEKDGASREMIELADECMIIPMLGFTQSFNISVAAALTLYHVRLMRQQKLGGKSELSEEQRNWLLAKYLAKSVGHAERVLLRKLH